MGYRLIVEVWRDICSGGIAVEDYYCWDAPVYAPCDGLVVVAKDGWLERPRTNLRADVRNAYRNATRFNPRCDDVRMIAGNYVIIQYAERVFAALCHLRMALWRLRRVSA